MRTSKKSGRDKIERVTITPASTATPAAGAEALIDSTVRRIAAVESA